MALSITNFPLWAKNSMATVLVVILSSSSSASMTVKISRIGGADTTAASYGNDDPTYGGSVGAGEFRVRATSSTSSESFKTFCLEYNEYISLGGTYKASINSGAIQGGLSGGSGGIDYISNATKWFYSSYRNNTLDLTGFHYDNDTEADALQLIIWRLEGEVELNKWAATGKTSLLGTSSIRAAADRLWMYYMDSQNKQEIDGFSDPNVAVVNLWKHSSNLNYALLDSSDLYRMSKEVRRARAQSQLYYHAPMEDMNATVPEPSTLVVWGCMLLVGATYCYRHRIDF